MELNQGPTYLCWLFCVEEAANASGYAFDKFACYRAVKGTPYIPPGQAASFDELSKAVLAAGSLLDVPIIWFNGDGFISDFSTFDAVLQHGGWFVIAGVQEGDLQVGQTYGHYLLARDVGGSDVAVIDSYRLYDGGSDRYTLRQFHQAMKDNWDPVHDALAFRLG